MELNKIKEFAWKELKKYMFIYDSPTESREITQESMRYILDQAIEAAMSNLIKELK